MKCENECKLFFFRNSYANTFLFMFNYNTQTYKGLIVINNIHYKAPSELKNWAYVFLQLILTFPTSPQRIQANFLLVSDLDDYWLFTFHCFKYFLFFNFKVDCIQIFFFFFCGHVMLLQYAHIKDMDYIHGIYKICFIHTY